MRFLFIHQNFPGQFKHIATALAENPQNEVVALTIREISLQGPIRIIRYHLKRGSTKGIHPWMIDLETKVIRGEAFYHAGQKLKEDGFVPDLIIAHPGWGESLFVKNIWPAAKLLIYTEFFYAESGGDASFDPEFHYWQAAEQCRIQMKNANHVLHFPLADAALSPTQWQRQSFPEYFRSKIQVIHDGIDTKRLTPDPAATLTFNQQVFSKQQPIITFVNRNLEPYRGYHCFMRALPELQKRLPEAQILIVGGDQVSYGSAPPDGKSWKQIFLDEVKSQVDESKIHFLGKVPYDDFIRLLQVSTVHVYLTYPFVLSWSLLEAMSAGCAIVASDTAPVREVVSHGEQGLLVDFFSAEQLVSAVVRLFGDDELRIRLGTQAREHVVRNYDLQSICLPRMKQLLQDIIAR